MAGLVQTAPKLTDWLADGETGIEKKPVLKTGDWLPYLPREEKQYREYSNNNYDTSSCTSFSTLSCIETQLNALEWGETGRQLANLGVTDNFADRYTAILSGTVKNVGVAFPKVFDTIKQYGLLPEMDLPFGGETWEEYMGFNNLTGEMLEKGQKIGKLIDTRYQYCYLPQQPYLNLTEWDKALEWLKISPLLASLDRGGGAHAVMIVSKDFYFDSYPPFIKPLAGEKIHYAYSYVARPKVEKKAKYPVYRFTRDVQLYEKSRAVVMLQEALIAYGCLAKGLNTGYYGNLTMQAVHTFQLRNGLTLLPYADKATRTVLNRLCA